MSTAAVVGGTLAGGIASAAIGSNAAGKAADTQANAANNAALLQKQAADQALGFQKQTYGNSLQLAAPWLNTGSSAIQRLGFLMGLNPQDMLSKLNLSGTGTGAQGPGNQTQPGTAGAGGTGFNPGNAGGFNPLANDPSLGTLPGGGSLPRYRAFQDVNGAQLNPGNMPAGFNGNGQTPGTAQQPAGQPGTITASPYSGQVGQTSLPGGGFGVNPQNPDPNDPSGQFTASGTGGLGINGGPDGLMTPGTAATPGGGTTATTNQGGSAQVPRIDGGGAPGGAATPGGDFGSLAQGFNEQFQSPTDVTEQNDPGYKFRLQQGQEALQNSAAARGGLLSGGTAKALSDYNQNAASAEYGNVYNRAYNNFTTKYNQFKQNQNDLFNRYATLSGIGQTSAGQLSNAGLNFANNASGILQNSANQIGQQGNNAAAANASGYVGGANAITGAIGNSTNSLSSLALLLAQRGGPTATSAG